VRDISRAAGISESTFFRYYASKNDVAWGDFDDLVRFEGHFDALSATVSLATALRECILAFNGFTDNEPPWIRRRMTLLLKVTGAPSALCAALCSLVRRRRGIRRAP
jgi:TetR/AcrR family transcriptional regulator, regulator of mycofactocin system